DEMRSSDGTVRSILLATKLPIIRAEWYIEKASEDAQDQEIADFVKSALFDWMELPWDSFLRQALLMMDFGVMVFEKVFALKDAQGKIYVTWGKLAPRMPKSIFRWEMAGGKPGIQQQLVAGPLVEIPREKLVIFQN